MSTFDSSRRSRWPVLLSALTCVVAAVVCAAPPPRVVAIGDVHGAGAQFTSILQRAGLIDAQKRWSGGTTILVQTGDLLDRGVEARQVLELVMALETQAAAAGGRVQALLGNHEVMNVLGETRDVAPELYPQFADERSATKREEAFQTASKISGRPIDKTEWLKDHPLGYVEYREAFAPGAPYGKWLRSKPIAAEIAGTLFMHGGINPEFTSDSLDNINKRVRREIAEFDDGVRWLQQHDLAASFSTLAEVVRAAQNEWNRIDAKRKRDSLSDEDVNEAKLILPILKLDSSALLNANGPLWFRGYSTWTDAEGSEQVPALLKKYKVKRIVTAHTPQPSGQITARFSNTLYLIDTGMLDGRFYPNGRPSALEIDGENAKPIYADR